VQRIINFDPDKRSEYGYSVQRLYRELPETTKVYPGHGDYTDIGSEKRSNKEVSEEVISVKN
jgi:glyoxylase-like metal-dependent hydrolase (beta-lactamase superfamily II)